MNLKFNKTFDMDLELHYGILEYACGLDPREEWEVRGIAGHRHDSLQKIRKERQNKVKKRIKEPQVQKKVKKIEEECFNLFQSIISNNDKEINYYLKDRFFYFITGATRTAGTYVMKEMSKALDWPMKELLIYMTHDWIPNPKFIVGGDFGWKKPSNYYNVIYQLAQLLVYINHAVDGEQDCVIKHEGFSGLLPIIDNIFNEKATYIVTVRHPAAVIRSRMNWAHERELVEKNYEKYIESRLNAWELVYTSIAENKLPQGDIIPLLFGSDIDDFLSEFFKKNNFSEEPSGIKITQRDYDLEYWNKKNINNRLKRIAKLWDVYNLQFPIPEKIR